MLRKTKASMLTLATILAAGCASSDLGSKARKNARWALLDEPKNRNVEDVPEPKILPQTYFAAARLLEEEGDFGAAIVQFRKAIAVNHNFVGAYHRLGVLLSSMGLHDEAIQSLSRATMLAPDNVVVRNNYGFALMVNQRWEEAAAQFRRCTELQPQFTRAYVNLGMTLTRLDRFDEALATFRRVLPEPDAHYNLGLMYRALGRYDEAAESFRSALAVNAAFLAANAELNEIANRLASSRSSFSEPSSSGPGSGWTSLERPSSAWPSSSRSVSSWGSPLLPPLDDFAARLYPKSDSPRGHLFRGVPR